MSYTDIMIGDVDGYMYITKSKIECFLPDQYSQTVFFLHTILPYTILQLQNIPMPLIDSLAQKSFDSILIDKATFIGLYICRATTVLGRPERH